MYCSICGAPLTGNFCSICGAQKENIQNQLTPEYSSSVFVQTTVPVQNQILIISKNCIDMLNERKKAIQKGFDRMMWCAALPFLIMILQVILSDDDRRHSQNFFEGPMATFLIIYIIIIVAVAIYVKKRDMAFDEEYRRYCSAESLIVDYEKIHGYTSKGSFRLKYDQIKSVYFSQNIWPQSNGMSNEHLIVKDLVGNSFSFYSFTNSKESKSIIEAQVRRHRNDSMS